MLETNMLWMLGCLALSFSTVCKTVWKLSSFLILSLKSAHNMFWTLGCVICSGQIYHRSLCLVEVRITLPTNNRFMQKGSVEVSDIEEFHTPWPNEPSQVFVNSVRHWGVYQFSIASSTSSDIRCRVCEHLPYNSIFHVFRYNGAKETQWSHLLYEIAQVVLQLILFCQRIIHFAACQQFINQFKVINRCSWGYRSSQPPGKISIHNEPKKTLNFWKLPPAQYLRFSPLVWIAEKNNLTSIYYLSHLTGSMASSWTDQLHHVFNRGCVTIVYLGQLNEFLVISTNETLLESSSINIISRDSMYGLELLGTFSLLIACSNSPFYHHLLTGHLILYYLSLLYSIFLYNTLNPVCDWS